MKITDMSIPELKVIEVKPFTDDRGYFFEAYSASRYVKELGLQQPFVLDNISYSKRGVLRGLHFQNPKTQGKLVSVLQGEVLDVAVDVRIGSPTFGEWESLILSSQNRKQLWIPRGFAHGFVVLSETALFSYKCDEYYSPKDEVSIVWNDPNLRIDWRVREPLLSPKDAEAPLLRSITKDKLPLYNPEK